MSLEFNSIYNLNSIDGMKDMDPESVDLVVTSPPYDNLRTYNDSSQWDFEVFKQVAEGLVRILKPGGVIAWNVADAVVPDMHGKKSGPSKTGSSFRQCLHFMELGLNFHDHIIYQKQSARFAAGKNSLRYSDVYEYVFILSKGRPEHLNLLRDKVNDGAGKVFRKDGGRAATGERIRGDGRTGVIHDYGVRNNIWMVVNSYGAGQSDKRAYEHPALMPQNLVYDLIRSYSNPGDVVMDPFMGSGTTARMAYAADRDYIGFEIDKTFFDLAIDLTTQEKLDFARDNMNDIMDKITKEKEEQLAVIKERNCPQKKVVVPEPKDEDIITPSLFEI